MNTDIIVCHPKDLLYPEWMHRMNADRNLFSKIIVVMTQSSTNRNYTDYLKKNLKNATYVEHYKDDGHDWRDSAINEALYESTGSTILFLEQDFIVDEGFFEDLLDKAKDYNTVGFRDGERFHPACLLVNRSILDRTRKDFSVDPDKGDHFSKLTTDLEKFNNWCSLENMNLPKWNHISGLSQNFRLESNFHKAKEFYHYLMESLEYDQPEDFRKYTISKAREVLSFVNK